MINKGDWDLRLNNDDHLPEYVLIWRISTTPIGATNNFYNSEGNIVDANQTECKVTWRKYTICIFDGSAVPQRYGNSTKHDTSDINVMFILQEQFNDYDSSSNNSRNNDYDYDVQYLPPNSSAFQSDLHY